MGLQGGRAVSCVRARLAGLQERRRVSVWVGSRWSCQAVPTCLDTVGVHTHTLIHTPNTHAFHPQALPIFLDKLANPVTAIIVSVTAVLFFGEIIPQALCSRWVEDGWGFVGRWVVNRRGAVSRRAVCVHPAGAVQQVG